MLVPHLIKGSSKKVFRRAYSPVHSILVDMVTGGLEIASISLLRGSQVLGNLPKVTLKYAAESRSLIQLPHPVLWMSVALSKLCANKWVIENQPQAATPAPLHFVSVSLGIRRTRAEIRILCVSAGLLQVSYSSFQSLQWLL